MVSVRIRRIAITGAVCLLAAAAVTGCGKQGSDDSGSKGGGGSNKGPKVGLVTDVGGLNDRSFNFLANKGFEQARDELGSSGSVIESKSASDYERNLGTGATSNDLVVGIGFLMGDAVKNTAAKLPDTDFAIVDYTYDGEDGAWTATDNVAGILFKEQEAGYLAGVLAGAAEQDSTLEGLNDKHVVSAVGGQEIPPVVKYIAGFKAGVMSQCKDCTVLVDYSQDFIDQSKCQDRARKQIAKGSDIVFQVAGQCGLGALSAAKSAKVWGIGVDADQGYLGAHILTSAVKRVDQAVFQMIKDEDSGDFPGGKATVFGLAEDGVGIGDIAEPAQQYADLVDEARDGIVSGDITVPETL